MQEMFEIALAAGDEKGRHSTKDHTSPTTPTAGEIMHRLAAEKNDGHGSAFEPRHVGTIG